MATDNTEIQVQPRSELLPSWMDVYVQKGLKIPRSSFQESWLLTTHDPQKNRAVWLRFSLLSSANWFRRIAEVCACVFEKSDSGELTKSVLKQTYDINTFRPFSEGGQSGFSLGPCQLTPQGTSGKIRSKGRTLRWDLQFSDLVTSGFSHSFSGLHRLGLIRNQVKTAYDRLKIFGTMELDGKKSDWSTSTGVINHQSGPRNSISWMRVHCDQFKNNQGQDVPFSIHGISARSRLFGVVPVPSTSSFIIEYSGEKFTTHSLFDVFKLQSSQRLDHWEFQVNRGPLSFRGEIQAQLNDFAGLTSEDTDGTLLYSAEAGLADLTMNVYRKGSLENSFFAQNACTFEVVSRQKNQYINYQA